MDFELSAGIRAAGPAQQAYSRSGRAAGAPELGRGGSYLGGVKLAVGDAVVYAAYGVGFVAVRERRLVLGVEQDVVVLELAGGLSVTLPVVRAREQLRSPVSEAGIRRVQETLRDDGEPSREVWLKRKRQTEAKLTGGDPLKLAEVVRDGVRRKQTLLAEKRNSRLSLGENDLYEKARQLLVGEIGVACGLDPAEADAWIDKQIAARAA
jgi:RNA polymerase-interacting CarD/CdnL/TRCF family regulator